MKSGAIISKLNWRQVLMHFLAFWFFVQTFLTISYLWDTKLIEVVRHSNTGELTQKLTDNHVSASDISYFILWTNISGQVGLLVAFGISLTISIRRRWFWLNSVIVFVATYFLYRFNLLDWLSVRNFFWRIGQTFSNTTIEFTVNSILLLSIGCLILFLPPVTKFIESGKKVTA
jgi:hypothetical protein